MKLLRRALILLALLDPAHAQQPLQISSFAVGPDQTLTYPNNAAVTPYLNYLPDEHTTFLPPASGSTNYLVFAAAEVSGGNFGAVVLETPDLKNFTFATAFGYNPQVMTSPLRIGKCNPTDNTEFDLNYAAPSSVVQDPTLPPGNLIMLFEAENHCPGGVSQGPFYATVGFMRSSDNGKTWPAPEDGVLGGPNRFPILQTAQPPPTTTHSYLGNAIPTGFVDKDPSGDYYLYVSYGHYDNGGNPPGIGVARAKLGVNPLIFQKWYNGAFSQPGIGGLDTDPLPAGACTGKPQYHPEINYNDDLGLYLMMYWCGSAPNGATVTWYYSTATSLGLQDWTPPQMIQNSQVTTTSPCADGTAGQQFEGWYPSSVSPGAAAGHTKLTGSIFSLAGCVPTTPSSAVPDRRFLSRTFTITAVPAPAITVVANAEGENPVIAPNTWVEIKGLNLAPAGDSRIWQTSDFANGQMPAKLDGVSVTVNGKSAYIYYISPTQVNILTPPDAIQGAVAVQVTNNGAISQAFTAQAQPLSPSFFNVSGGLYVLAQHSADYSLVGPASFSVPGYTFTPAKPGETVLIYANGFGPTSVPVVNGSQMQSGTLFPLPVVTIGGIPATVSFAGINVAPGLFQFNVVIPPNAPSGDNVITATYNGASVLPVSLITIQASAPPPTSVTFYVAPNGNDFWSGRLAAPNSTGTDGPLASFDRARALVQSISKAGLSQLNVQFRSGTYYLPAAEVFSAADSGSATLQIVYQSYPGESPVISGGVRVQNWTNASGNTWKATLPASAQYFENLFYNGVRRLRPRLGVSAGNNLGAYFRYVGPVYLSAAGPPAAAPDQSCSVYFAGSGWKCYDRFQYQPTDPIVKTWKNLVPSAGNHCGQPAGNQAIAGDIELVNFEQYSVSKLRFSCIDTVNHIAYLTGETAIEADHPTAHGFIPNHRYLVENIQDELTQPGQWFLDRSASPWVLTYLANPGENPNTDIVIVPQLTQVLVATGLQYVTFQGLTFEHDNYTIPATGYNGSSGIIAGVSFQNSQHITFNASIVTQTAGVGLEFISCIDRTSLNWCVSLSPGGVSANNLIENSAFYELAADSIRIGTSGSPTDTNANVPQFHTVQNNVVEGYGRVYPGSKAITQGQGHDNLYTHNDIYDGYKGAIHVCYCANSDVNPPFTNNNVISFNHVYNLFQGLMNDSGSLYFGVGTPSPPSSGTGNKMLNNKVHDVNDASVWDSDGYGGDGLYADDFSGLVDMENNLVYRVSGNAISFSGPRAAPNQSSTVKNNILAYARQSLLNSYDPYSFHTEPPLPQFFTASGNLFYFDRNGSESFYVQGGCTYAGEVYTAYEQWTSNLYWRTDGAFAADPQAFHVQQSLDASGGCGNSRLWTYYTFAGWQGLGEDIHSVVQNPGFKNPAYPADDYSLPKGSPGAGFVVFDPTQAGRSNPVLMPPAVPATFPTKTFNPATDF